MAANEPLTVGRWKATKPGALNGGALSEQLPTLTTKSVSANCITRPWSSGISQTSPRQGRRHVGGRSWFDRSRKACPVRDNFDFMSTQSSTSLYWKPTSASAHACSAHAFAMDLPPKFRETGRCVSATVFHPSRARSTRGLVAAFYHLTSKL